MRLALLLVFALSLPACAPRLGDDDDSSDDDDAADDDDAIDDDDDLTPPPYEPSWTAGWSFGKCWGTCIGSLHVADDGLVTYSISNWDGEVFLERSSDALPESHARLQALQDAVDIGSLDPVYGCPDCADGGAQNMNWDLGPVLFSVSYEFGNPPPELADLHDLAALWQQELAACEFSELAPLAECEPFEG